MVISFHAGNRIQGLSTDIVETPTFSDDFSGADNWTDAGSGIGVNTNTDVIDWNCLLHGNHATSYDLGAGNVSSTAWILRGKISINSITQGTSFGNIQFFIGLGDKDSSQGSYIPQDFIGFSIRVTNTTKLFYYYDVDNGTLHSTFGEGTFTTLPSNTTYYVEIIRLSSTSYKVNLYSNPEYSVLVETKTGNIPSSIQNLRYIKIQKNENDLSTEDHTLNGTVDDIKFYNGVSSLTSKPTNVPEYSRFEETNTRKIYSLVSSPNVLNDDFTSYADTTAGDLAYPTNSTGTMRVNPTNDNISLLANLTANAVLYRDIGYTLSNQWILEFKFVISAYTAYSTGGSASHMSISLNSTTGDRLSTPRDGLGVYLNTNGSTMKGFYTNNADINVPTLNSVILLSLTTATRWIRCIRLNSTTFRIELYSDAYTTLIASTTFTIPADVTGLRYFVVASDSGAGTGSITATIDDIKIYNGISSIPNWWEK